MVEGLTERPKKRAATCTNLANMTLEDDKPELRRFTHLASLPVERMDWTTSQQKLACLLQSFSRCACLPAFCTGLTCLPPCRQPTMLCTACSKNVQGICILLADTRPTLCALAVRDPRSAGEETRNENSSKYRVFDVERPPIASGSNRWVLPNEDCTFVSYGLMCSLLT